jgi:hypothetical protein
MLSQLFLSSDEAGGACNTFEISVTHELKERQDKSVAQGAIGYSLDEIAEMLGTPDHLKIDVDGLEHMVIAGAHRILEKVKSLLVEVNTNLVEHRSMVSYLESVGFGWNSDQVKSATRTEGPFKGCAEYVFRRAEWGIAVPDFSRAAIEPQPFPWIYMEDVFAPSLYRKLIEEMPTQYTEIAKSRSLKGYPLRYTATPTPLWQELFDRLRDGRLKRQLCDRFKIKENPDTLEDECLLIRDQPGYVIGPHTDSPNKVITVLFYLPKDESMVQAGTSIYIPKKKGFTCKGGPHHSVTRFDMIRTMPFKPNSVFAFLKTDNSFHGVEPCQFVRDVLLYDIKRK